MAGMKDGLIGAGLLLLGAAIGVTVAVKQPIPQDQTSVDEATGAAESAEEAAATQQPAGADTQDGASESVTGESGTGDMPADFGR